MAKGRRVIRTNKRVKPYTYLGCSLTKNRTPWCFRLCRPNADGTGHCGRLAPHSMMSSIQLAILKHKLKRAQEDK